MNSEVSVPITTITENFLVPVKVTGMKTWQVRVWIGAKLMVLAAIIMGCSIEVDTQDTTHQRWRRRGVRL